MAESEAEILKIESMEVDKARAAKVGVGERGRDVEGEEKGFAAMTKTLIHPRFVRNISRDVNHPLAMLCCDEGTRTHQNPGRLLRGEVAPRSSAGAFVAEPRTLLLDLYMILCSCMATNICIYIYICMYLLPVDHG